MPESRHRDGVYEFGDFRLFAAQRRVTTRKDDRAIELSQKAFDALHYLIQHRGELLEKGVLLSAVWPSVVVEENSLNQVISALRRALGDGTHGRRFIVTVPGRGYQFVAPVREVAAESTPPSDTPAASARSAGASIAVLPFASLSSDPERDYFGDGIAEELIHLLSRVPGLRVPARTSSFAYKGRNIDVRQIARELGVGMLLEGSVRSSGERIRVTAQLIEAESGFHLWSQTYDRRFADVFQLQDELSGAIVHALKSNLGGPVPARLRDAPPTKNVEAYRLVLQARAQRESLGLERTLALLRESIALDPGFARAHAELAVTCNLLFTLGLRGPEILVEAQRGAEQALHLDPDSADAHAAIGLQDAVRGNWLCADQSFRRALELDPMEALTRNTYALWVLGPAGKCSEALTHAVEAYALAPATPASAINLAGFSTLNERDEEASRYVQVARDLGATGPLPLSIFSSEIARHAGQYATAAEHVIMALPKALRTKGIEDVVRQAYDALADVRLAPRAVAAVKALRTQAEVAALETYPMSMLTLLWYAWLGAWDEAYETWQRMVRAFKVSGVLNSVEFLPIWMPELRDFRRDPRFQDIVRQLGLIEYWRERGPPDQCLLEGDRLIVL